MELREKIGQLLIVGFHGTFPEDEGVKILSEQIKASLVGVLFLMVIILLIQPKSPN
ncbi:MAG: hypothetical protein H6925_05500 [Holosporaceae bacterium]|nr:MAG: hypothetical protein H6925_05500 [Holosporaceae bacterium]